MGSARDVNAMTHGVSVGREAGDLLEVADGGIATHIVLLLDVFEF